MSELKVIDLGNIRESIEKGESVYYEYYPKSESDKVIAEKDKELRHQKFKRCLAMAEFCQYRSEMFFTWSKKMGFLLKWQNRWLEIAEQFKETK